MKKLCQIIAHATTISMIFFRKINQGADALLVAINNQLRTLLAFL